MEQNDVVIVAAKRTPVGNFMGSLGSLSAPELGAVAFKGTVEASTLNGGDIDEVIGGCVLQAGLGQAPIRQAAIKAGIPNHVGAFTLNKMCGSGLKAIMMGHDAIKAGSANIILAGGMESMSNAPYLLLKARGGYRLGHGELKDSMFYDGLEDAYDKGRLMGVFAEQTASHFKFTRLQQDEFAEMSLKRAVAACESNLFVEEIIPVTYADKKTEVTVSRDEGPDIAKLPKISQLKPAFSPEGTVTAANSSSISDGAAAVMLMSYDSAQKRGVKPIARIVAHATHAQAPQWFTTAPVEAISKVLTKAQWSKQDVDLFEINEAFAVVAMAAIQQLELDITKVNVNGGACALGHPIGASGARLIVTLIHALKHQNKKRGVAALCIGGGEAVAMAIELV